MQLAHIKSHKI